MLLFLYGTLLDAATLARHSGDPRLPRRLRPARLDGFARTGLRGTPYPPLVPRPGATVAGAVLRAGPAARQKLAGVYAGMRQIRERIAKEGAENAARRMFMPVFSSTLTTVIAFFGLVDVGGRFGGLIADIPFTVIVVLVASLVECFLFLPNNMAHALAHTAN